MLAAKFFDDQYFNNAYYAKVSLRAALGISIVRSRGQDRLTTFHCAPLLPLPRASRATHPITTLPYLQVGGVPTNEVNALELEFLFSVNFSLHVATDVFEKYFR